MPDQPTQFASHQETQSPQNLIVAQQISAVAQRIIDNIKNPNPGIPLSNVIPILSDRNEEIIRIASEVAASDQFYYILRIDHKRKVYWLTKMGGVAGIAEEIGLVDIDKSESSSVIHKTSEPAADSSVPDE